MCAPKWELACRKQRGNVAKFGTLWLWKQAPNKGAFGVVSPWEQLFSHWRVFLPELENNWDTCIQRSREQTMLGTLENVRPAGASALLSPQRTVTVRVALSNLIRTILQHSWAISVVSTEFLLCWSLCRKSTTDLANQMIFLKRIIYGGLAIFRVTLQREVIMETLAEDSFFLLTSVQYLLSLESDLVKSFILQGVGEQGITGHIGEHRLASSYKL